MGVVYVSQLLRIRHTSAHVMAMAVQRLFPKVQVTIGSWIDNHVLLCFPTAPMTTFTVFSPLNASFTLTDVSYHPCIRFSHRSIPRVVLRR
jgi:hypothetical protein